MWGYDYDLYTPDEDSIHGSKLEELKYSFESLIDFLYSDIELDDDEIDHAARQIGQILSVNVPAKNLDFKNIGK